MPKPPWWSMEKQSKELGVLAKGAPGPRTGEIIEQTVPFSQRSKRPVFLFSDGSDFDFFTHLGEYDPKTYTR